MGAGRRRARKGGQSLWVGQGATVRVACRWVGKGPLTREAQGCIPTSATSRLASHAAIQTAPGSRVVEHEPRPGCSAQRRRALNFVRPHQHACSGVGRGRWEEKERAMPRAIRRPAAQPAGAPPSPPDRQRALPFTACGAAIGCNSPVGLHGLVMTTSLGGAGPASSAASQSKSGWP